MHRRRKLKKEYRLLTSLRALGFVGVSLFHRFSHLFPGGYMAVIIFLVLSGFLTMKGAEKKTTSKNLSNKFIKLMGPVFLMMALVMTLTLFTAREIFDDSIKSVIPVTLSFENIARIITNEDYFNQLGNFNIFNHMWYVSLYMQLVLIATLINNITYKASDNIKLAIYGLITLLSFVAISLKVRAGADISRIYYGIDTRISAFSLGSFLYLLDKKFSGNFMKTRQFLMASSVFFAVLVIGPFFLVNGKDISSYGWIFILYTFAVGFLILNLYNLEDRYFITGKKTLPISTYIGKRSYYLYLWQYVVQILVLYFMRDSNIFVVLGIEIAILFSIAELNYQLFKNKNITKVLMAISTLALIILFVTSLFIGNAKEEEIAKLRAEITANEEAIKRRNKEAKLAASRNAKARTPAENDEFDRMDRTDDDQIVTEEIDEIADEEIVEEVDQEVQTEFYEKSYDDFDFTENELAYLRNLSVTAVGDSVIINADSYIRNFIPNFYLDGEVGRDMIHGPEILANIANEGGLGDIILISLGSNGSANISDMDMIMNIAGGRDVYFVNTSHTQSYMDFVNRNIADYCESHEKAHLVDWRGWIKDRPDYLAQDRTHPNIPGADGFAKLIMRKILNVNKVAP